MQISGPSPVCFDPTQSAFRTVTFGPRYLTTAEVQTRQQMAECRDCCTLHIRRAVCIRCHEQMKKRLGDEIRRLQIETNNQQSTISLLKVIGQAAVSKLHE